MAEVVRSLRCLTLCLVVLPLSTADQNEIANKCFEDNDYVYFLHREDKTWYGASSGCRSNNRDLASNVSSIKECIRKSYDENDTVSVWTESSRTTCYYADYNAGAFNDSWTFKCLILSKKFVCSSEKTIQETPSISTTILPVEDATETKTFTSFTSSTIGTEVHASTTVTSMRLRTTKETSATTSGSTPFISTQLTQAAEGTTIQNPFLSFTEVKRTTPLEQSLTTSIKGGAVGGIVVGLILFCTAVVVGLLLIIRRRNQQREHKKQKDGVSNVACGFHSPEIIPLQGSSQDRHTDAGYFEVEPHSLTQGGNNNREAIKGESTEENVELSSSQLEDNLPNTYTVGVPTTDNRRERFTAAADADDNDTYDHINKQASPVHNVEENVYSHTNNDANDEYSHISIKGKTGDKPTPLGADNVYSHTGAEQSL